MCPVHLLANRGQPALNQNEPHQLGQLNQRQVRHLPSKWLWTAGPALLIVAMLAKKLYDFWVLDQTYAINCANNVSEDFKQAESGDAIAQYCLAGRFKKGNEVIKSLEKAREWYKKASDQGLFLATEELCSPSTFADALNDKQARDRYYADLGSLCSCTGKSICPWDEVTCPDLLAYDAPTVRHRFFGNRP